MNILPRAIDLPQNTPLFHYSSSLADLLSDGAFAPSRSQFDGLLFFTNEPTLLTNCIVRTRAPLHLFVSITPRQEIAYAKKAGFDFRIDGPAHGIDGIVIEESPDPYTLKEDNTLANEVVIFGASAHKLGKVALF